MLDVNDELDGNGARPKKKAKVLLAEDDTNMRALVADILRKEGLEVEEVADGHGLLMRVGEAYFQGQAVELIVSDVRMPYCSGLDVLVRVRRARWTTPILLMTAFGEQGLEARVRELGGRILDKPFTPVALRRTVREMLGRS
jgi:DNA-binding response OmpR family regulator